MSFLNGALVFFPSLGKLHPLSYCYLNAPNGSFFLLPVYAYNPKGVDPSVEQWREIFYQFKIRALKRAAMATFSCPFHPTNYKRIQKTNVKAHISCSFQPSQSNIKDFLLWGRGCDQWCSKGYWRGCNSGRNYSKRNGSSWCCGFCSCRTRCWKGLWYGGALEIPIISDLTMILGSISQSKAWASSSISLTVLLFMTMCNGLLLLQLEFLVVQRFVISIFTVGVFS
eukprot:TRINITY_DN4505_c0_g2_i12.p1 TRINITY_DN4505_c0_g2~~TRINITY_DN4505_c0_g2_i12.p1  ORF type:complete len:226 (-),score=20.88 TRINITY_DN4505_c0_g2_i12:271-948(-)